MGKLIIDNRSSVDDIQAMLVVSMVVERGRISNEGKQYCYATTFTLSNEDRVAVYTDLNEKSDRFVVCDDPPKPLQTAKVSK